MKTVPRDWINAEMLGWMPWESDRVLPFFMKGAKGNAWVKVLSWDRETGAESLLYRLDPGWEIDEITNTVPEDLMVWHGELQVGDQTLRKYGYSYRPPGYSAGPCSAPVGATIVAFCGGPSEPRYSKIPVPALDTESMPWTPNRDLRDSLRYYKKPLRGDEETLDIFELARAAAGSAADSVDAHELATHHGMGALEEGFFFEAAGPGGLFEAWDGRVIRMGGGPGTYVCHGSAAHRGSGLGFASDLLCYTHDGYEYSENPDPISEERLAMFPIETPAVQALREGRDPGLRTDPQ